jgi:hypothetical protein
MSSPARARGPLVTVVSLLTAIGLAGALVDAFGTFPAFGGIHGCAAGMLIGLVIGAVMIFMIAWGIVALVATFGLVLLANGSRWGPILLILSNLAVVAFFGFWMPVEQGELAWGLLLVLLALTPGVAFALLVHMVLSRGSVLKRVAVTAALAMLVAWPASVYADGLSFGFAQAITPSAPVLLSSGPHQAC